MIDGVECSIVTQSPNYIECITGEKASLNPDIGTPMIGTHGLRQMVCRGKTDVDTFVPEECDHSILTSFAGRFEQGDEYISHISGYFKAPVDGDYTFYAYGDDVTILLIDDQTVSESSYYDAFGNVFANTPSSGPVALTEGETKKILLKFKEGSGGDFS